MVSGHPITEPYTWIFGVACAVAFIAAFGIGANDVANSFASSVGAKALTLPSALLVAAIFEFGGAMLLGSNVAETVQGGIVNRALFEGTPDLFMFAFFCVMLAAAFWDNAACYLALPVSTTHTTVGATIGAALAVYGGHAVTWWTRVPEFPFVGGIAPIVLSWVVSPLLAGAFVAALFGSLRAGVLRSPHSFGRALVVLPACVWLLVFTIVVTVAQTYYKNRRGARALPRRDEGVTIGIAAGAGAAAAAVAAGVTRFVLKPSVERAEERALAAVAARKAAVAEAARAAAAKGRPPPNERAVAALADIDDAAYETPSLFHQKLAAAWTNFRATRFGSALVNNPAARAVSHGASYRVHDALETDERVAEVWESAEVFDFKTERLFRYLQICTACAMAFAHGSNDVGNAVGPFAAVYSTWRYGRTPGPYSPLPLWILALGGAGIVTGLAVMGYKVLAVLAVKSVKLTNSRGFCVELASALTVVLASRYGLPVSTTQTVCGAVVAVGLMEGASGVNWRVAARMAVGWVLTLVVAAAVAAALTAAGVYTPNKTASLAAAAVRAAAAPAAGAP